jgi:hypothetical protein
MGNTNSEPEPFDSSFSNDDGFVAKHDTTRDRAGNFVPGQSVNYPGGQYIGTKVVSTRGAGNQDAIVNIPTLAGDTQISIPRSQLGPADNDATPVQHGNEWLPNASRDKNSEAYIIGLPCCTTCCSNHILIFRPTRVLASLFCSLNAGIIIYCFVALLLLSEMSILCNKFHPVGVGEGGRMLEAYDADAAGGVTQSYGAAVGAEDYSGSAAAAEGGYEAKEDYAAKNDGYEAHSAYVAESFFEYVVGPGCNRVIIFACVWSIIMGVATSIYGCCLFRHWRSYAHVLGFWVACLYFLAFDFFSIAILFAVDASNVINIDQELHVNHGVYKGKQYTLGRRLKAASNPLSYVYEYEVLASIVAFILSYFYLIMGLNLYRYKADMMHDWQAPRLTAVDSAANTVFTSDPPNSRVTKKKSLYYSEEDFLS